MRIRWTAVALRALGRHITFIARDSPDAAERVQRAIVEAVERLADQPHRGRPGQRAGTRELVIAAFPSYIIVYRVTATEIRIIQVWHGRQDRAR
jgi:addiction module RelE/StbE family toxin